MRKRAPLSGALALLFSLQSTLCAATIHVPDDHPTIQGALDAAANGDTIIVRPGTYVENIDFLGKEIALVSERGPAVTAIDGAQMGSVVAFASGEGPSAILSGFTITNGAGVKRWTHYGYVRLGGGIYCGGASPTLINNIVTNNALSGYLAAGGGIHLSQSSARVANNIVAGNTATGTAGATGGGIYCYGSPAVLMNNTVAANASNFHGGGIYCGDSPVTVVNTIVWYNSAPVGPAIHLFSGSIAVACSDVQGGWPGAGNIDADPLFADPATGDYHITWLSPCRDAGDSSAVADPVDFEGDPRSVPAAADMGADELYFHLYHGGAVAPGAPIAVKVVGYPTAPVILFLGAGLADPPYSTPHGDFWLTLPPLAQGSIGAVPATGVLIHPAIVPAGWAPGSAHPIQALVGPWGGTSTRLTNLHILLVR